MTCFIRPAFKWCPCKSKEQHHRRHHHSDEGLQDLVKWTTRLPMYLCVCVCVCVCVCCACVVLGDEVEWSDSCQCGETHMLD